MRRKTSAVSRRVSGRTLLVVDKPAGVVVHPGAGNADRTLVNGLLQIASGAEPRCRARASCIASTRIRAGCWWFATSAAALRRLTAALQRHEVTRRYTRGRRRCADRWSADRRADRARSRQSSAAAGGGRRPTCVDARACCVERYRAHCLITAELATGRTHQIRVHLSSIGHPLVGDRRYGARGRLPSRPSIELLEAIRGFRSSGVARRRTRVRASDHRGAVEFRIAAAGRSGAVDRCAVA